MESVETLLRYVCWDVFDDRYREVVRKSCNGCVVDHPSQDQHECMDPEDELVADWSLKAWNAIREDDTYMIFVQTSAELRLNVSSFDLSSVTDTIRMLRTGEACEIDISDRYRVAVQRAKDKVTSLMNLLEYLN